jgi:CIC family chloride channel protein
MFPQLIAAGAHLRVRIELQLVRFGFRERSLLVVLAFLIGIVTALAAVGFHELIDVIRRRLYGSVPPEVLYGNAVWLLIALPAAGGLAVGLLVRYVMRQREGHGIVDVLETVLRSSGMIKPTVALEKILTSAITIGSGGSAGAEGPIVQIGAGIASGIGQLFGIARPHMPVLIGCGSAAGISAIFNSPIGGLLFTLEVILRDFSIRTITPVVIASVMANFTTAALFQRLLHENYTAIFFLPPEMTGPAGPIGYDLAHAGNFILLGLACGIVGMSLTRLMHFTEQRFASLRLPLWIKPALGGALLGIIGLLYVIIIGHWLLGRQKFIPFAQYQMPAFFGEGYGAVRPMLSPGFYHELSWTTLAAILMVLCLCKIVGTCLTLGSGGAGGIIAPSLFLGAVTGGLAGLVLNHAGLSSGLAPQMYALVAMGAVLAAVVHAPLASILIVFDVTHNYDVVLPAMLATIVATAAAQLLCRDSIYTLGLKRRGIQVGTGADLTLLRRLTVEQVKLEPACVVHMADPLQRVLELTERNGTSDFVVYDNKGGYAGMVVGDDIKTVLLQREAVPLLTVGEMVRPEIPTVTTGEDLASVLDRFSTHDIARLPVSLSKDSGHVIGLISRSALMRTYQRALTET